MSRPSWDQYFLKIAQEVATRSTCLRRHVGCVLVLDKRILATGYNGVPTGIEHCETRGCLREQHNVPSGERHELCRGLHAEMNALLQGARGKEAVDLAAIASGLQRISQLVTDFPQIDELDINPYIVGALGSEPVVADARITLAERSAS